MVRKSPSGNTLQSKTGSSAWSESSVSPVEPDAGTAGGVVAVGEAFSDFACGSDVTGTEGGPDPAGAQPRRTTSQTQATPKIPIKIGVILANLICVKFRLTVPTDL